MMQKITITTVKEFQLMWWDQGTGGKYSGTFYRPIPPQGYYSIGDYGQSNYNTPSPNGNVIAIKDSGDGTLARPVGYQNIWDDRGSGSNMDGSFWRPIPPLGYKAVGCVVQKGYNQPSLDAVMCVREDVLSPGLVGKMVWNDKDTGANRDFSSWEIISQYPNGLKCGTFIGVPFQGKPSHGDNTFVLNIDALEIDAPKMDVLTNTNFIQSIRKISFNKNGCPLDYHSIAGNRWQHLQDMIRLPDTNGYQHYMGTFSQNCSDNEGGLVFVAQITESAKNAGQSGKVIWWDELNNKHLAGGFNHPGDLRRIGNIVVIAGQNWDGGSISTDSFEDFFKSLGSKIGQEFADQMHRGSGGQGVLFYDVTNPAHPKYLGKMNSCRKGNEVMTTNGSDIDMVTAAKSGDYYYLSFNGLKCRSKVFLPNADWEFVEAGNDGSPSPVLFSHDSQHIVGDAVLKDGDRVVFQKLEFSPGSDQLTAETIHVTRTDVISSTIPKSSLPDGATFSLSVMPNGRGHCVFANVESDNHIEIEEIDSISIVHINSFPLTELAGNYGHGVLSMTSSNTFVFRWNNGRVDATGTVDDTGKGTFNFPDHKTFSFEFEPSTRKIYFDGDRSKVWQKVS